MAIFHFSVSVISRSKGQSAIASAAYRSGDRLVDEQTGESKFYKRSVHPETFIMTPTVAPTWAHDRQRLWNAVEQAEKRKDAQLSREFNVALPQELSEADQRKLLKDYVQHEFVDQGMIADVAIHRDHPENPHAHVMLTLRTIDEKGFGKKNREWNAEFSNQRNGRGFVKSGEKVLDYRKQWQEYANRALEREGRSERIDHRSFEKQHSELMPSVHLGHVAAAMEKRGIQTERGDINRAAKEHNAIVLDLAKFRKQKEQLLTEQQKYEKALEKQEKARQPKTEPAKPIDLAEFKQKVQELIRKGDTEGLKALGDKVSNLTEKLKEIKAQQTEKPKAEQPEKTPAKVQPFKEQRAESGKAAPLMTVHLETDEWQALHQTKTAIGKQPTLENVADRLKSNDHRLNAIDLERQQKQQRINGLNEANRQTEFIKDDQRAVRSGQQRLKDIQETRYGLFKGSQKKADLSTAQNRLSRDKERLQARVAQLQGQAKTYGLRLNQTPDQVKEQIRGKVAEIEKDIQGLTREEQTIRNEKPVLEKAQKALYKQKDQPLDLQYGHSLKNARADLDSKEEKHQTLSRSYTNYKQAEQAYQGYREMNPAQLHQLTPEQHQVFKQAGQNLSAATRNLQNQGYKTQNAIKRDLSQQEKELERLRGYVNRHGQQQKQQEIERQRQKRRSLDGPER